MSHVVGRFSSWNTDSATNLDWRSCARRTVSWSTVPYLDECTRCRRYLNMSSDGARIPNHWWNPEHVAGGRRMWAGAFLNDWPYALPFRSNFLDSWEIRDSYVSMKVRRQRFVGEVWIFFCLWRKTWYYSLEVERTAESDCLAFRNSC